MGEGDFPLLIGATRKFAVQRPSEGPTMQYGRCHLVGVWLATPSSQGTVAGQPSLECVDRRGNI